MITDLTKEDIQWKKIKEKEKKSDKEAPFLTSMNRKENGNKEKIKKKTTLRMSGSACLNF